MKMREDVLNMLEQAARTLDAIPRGRNPHAGMYAFALRELGENLTRFAQHPELHDSFCEHYCLTADDLARKAA